MPSLRWTVRPGDGDTVADVLARAGADVTAVRDGRVFLGPRRVKQGDERVRPGDVVSVAAPLEGAAEAATILAQSGDLVAADKPAGIPTIPDHAGAAHSLLARVARALSLEPARVHPTSRLDRDVSGVVVFALSASARERLQRARAEGTYARRYLAITSRAPSPGAGVWDARIGRARDPRLRAVGGRDATDATTRYAVAGVAPGGQAILGVEPITGRTHQIRLHASHAGAPLLGDRAYGGPTRLTLPTGRVLAPGRIALHAARVVVPGERGARLPFEVRSPLPSELAELWSALGGEAAAWDLGLSCVLSSPSP